FWNLRGKLGPIGLRSIVATTARSLAIAAAGAAVGAGILMALGQVMGPTDRALTALVKCVIAGIPSLVVTYGLAMALRMPEADFVSSLLRRVLRRR
ncbi:MAG: murein biosynthesis integral membrane protein MurJ, partial [Atopobiaceae bacterium]|nr:murein biosynthesis integral membrane protein MurJ [Atopobiaceae bacterium]